MQEQNPEEWNNIKKELVLAKKNITEPAAKQALQDARAVIVRKPEDVIELNGLQTEQVEIEVLNDTHWPWKYNCTVGLAKNQTEENMPIQTFAFPIQNNVQGKSQFTVRVPIRATDMAQIDDFDKVYNVQLGFFEPSGKQFGSVFTLNVKCTTPDPQSIDYQHQQASHQAASGAPVWRY